MKSPVSWDAIGLQTAHVIAKKSKDPKTKVGCVLMSPDNKKIHWGYNGFAVGIEDTEVRWERPVKYRRVVHAEVNAIINAKEDIHGWTAYLTIFPCERCASLLIQSGVRRVVYSGEYAGKTSDLEFSKSLFDEAGVKYERKEIEEE